MLSHHAGARVSCLFAGARRRDELIAEAATVTHKRLSEVALITLDPALVAGLAHDATRHKWAVTIVGDHLYVDTGAATLDGAIERTALRE